MSLPDLHVAFRDFTFDSSTYALSRQAARVHLSPKAFDLLHLLLARRPAVVRRQAIEDALWPDTAVGVSSLSRLMAEVRAAIGETPSSQQLIRTVHRVGYAFVGATEPPPAPGAAASTGTEVQLLIGQQSVRLGEGAHVVGRGADSEVVLDQMGVSRRHARLVVGSGRVDLEDLGSRNGTFVNGTRIAGPVRLRPGDQIVMGTVVASLQAGDRDRTTEFETAAAPRPKTTRR